MPNISEANVRFFFSGQKEKIASTCMVHGKSDKYSIIFVVFYSDNVSNIGSLEEGIIVKKLSKDDVSSKNFIMNWFFKLNSIANNGVL